MGGVTVTGVGRGVAWAWVVAAVLSCGAEKEGDEDGIVCGLGPKGEAVGCVRIDQAVPFGGVDIGELEVVDLDGDGDEDLLSADGWMILQERGELRVQRVPRLPATWDQIQVGDLEGDGVPDVFLRHEGRILAIVGAAGGAAFLHELPFEGVDLFRVEDLDGDGRSEIATIHLNAMREDVEPPGPWNVLEVWGRDDSGEYSPVKDWRSNRDIETATRMEVLHFEPEGLLDFLFIERGQIVVRPYTVEGHIPQSTRYLFFSKFYAFRDVLRQGRRIAVTIAGSTHPDQDPFVVVEDWRDGRSTIASPVQDEAIHGLATGNLVGDARHEVLVGVSRDGGRPYLDVRCIGNEDKRQFELCGSVALEHVPERLAVLGHDDGAGAMIVYAAEGRLFGMRVEPSAIPDGDPRPGLM
jgi:hypothetical protein